jgi:hypothetical protein
MGCGGIAPPFFISALDGGVWSGSRPASFTPGEIARGTHWIRGWMGPGSGLNAADRRKIPYICRESNPACPTRRYTDRAIPVPNLLKYNPENEKRPI